MYIYFWLIIIFLVINSILLLDEELLIIIASIIWLDAAGGFIRSLLWSELEDRGTKIKNQFEWFLKLKLQLSDLVVSLYKKRLSSVAELLTLYNISINHLILNIVRSYLILNKEFKINSIISRVRKEVIGLTVYISYNEVALSLSQKKSLVNVSNGVL